MPYKDKEKEQKHWQKYRQTKKYKKYQKEYQQQYRDRGRNIIDQIKQEQNCFCCEESYPRCLDFHHLEKKEFNIGQCGLGKGIIRLIKEIEKCEILCSNCHRKREG